jgi:tetratricopeptide (TPR) repeat protein
MSEATEVGGVEAALKQAARLLSARPDLAERQARRILDVAPTDPRARMFLGAALRRQGQAGAARTVLAALARQQPASPQTHLELGLALAALGETDASLGALRHAVGLRRDLPDAWRAIADQLLLKGETAAADAAYGQYIRVGVADPALRAAAEALADDRLAIAERLLRERLRTHPSDVAAMRMLAETGARLGRHADAEGLLEHCLDLAPGFDAARHNLAMVLYRQQKAAGALPHIERLRAADPDETGYRNLHAACLAMVGDYERAIALYQTLLAASPDLPRVWLSLGHSLRTAGRRADAVAAYKRAIGLEPGLGDAYWSLANLKTEPFSPEDEVAMAARLREAKGEDAFQLLFALGKAAEDRADFATAFARYAEGARLRRLKAPYDADETSEAAAKARALFTAPFFAARAAAGGGPADPIFVIGLPRSGSTLVEQILASHSEVEGTMELPEIGALVRDFVRAARKGAASPYPEILAELDPQQLSSLRDAYLDRTRAYRKLGKARFIDKMPNNFRHLGLIQLILPNAKIIDARRHPMSACFSAFKQHFARGQNFSYDLGDLGRYYRDYLELMAHFDEVLPGRIHRVIYEDMVEDTEGEIRRLLDYCGLTFEPACLRFHENERAVRTASSEQVRRPIFRDGLDQWRRYEAWLGPLKDALGPAIETWRGAGPGAAAAG